MKKIWKFLVHHVTEDFNPKHYLAIAVLLSFSITLNYAYRFADDVLEPMRGIGKFFLYLPFYGIPYFFSVLSYTYFTGQTVILAKHEFWLKSIFGIVILSIDSSISFIYPLVTLLSPPALELWLIKVSVNAASFLTVLLPIVIFYKVFEQGQKQLYGLSPNRFDARPYFVMLLILLPFIIGASFNASFQRQYPMYRSSEAHGYLGVSEWVTVAGYELAYGLDFITVEYLFRGFFVIGMMSVLGRGAVLSMAVIYCFLHFGKPPGEAISSIAGGYILGVVAYETKSIWGGIIVHVGLAWMMEMVAFLRKLPSL